MYWIHIYICKYIFLEGQPSIAQDILRVNWVFARPFNNECNNKAWVHALFDWYWVILVCVHGIRYLQMVWWQTNACDAIAIYYPSGIQQ